MFYPVDWQRTSCKHVFSIRVENSVDPDQIASFERLHQGLARQAHFGGQVKPNLTSIKVGAAVTCGVIDKSLNFTHTCLYEPSVMSAVA